MNLCQRILLTVFILGIYCSLTFALGVELAITNQLQYQTGREVSPFISESYPHNLVARRFFENLTTVDLYFEEVRIGFRYTRFEPSQIDQRLWALQNESDIDKRFIEWSHGGLGFRAGHFPAIFGQGLTLYLFEDRLLYHDTELDGIKISVERGPFRFTALKGGSREWGAVHATTLMGFNAEATSGSLRIGANYVRMDSSGYAEADLPGGYVDYSIGPVALYGEYAEKATKIIETVWGNALYLSGSAAVAGFSLFADYKYYHYQGATPFQNPPIVQRELTSRLLQSREPHVINLDDEVGFQIEGKATPINWATVTINFTHSSAIIGRDVIPSNHQEDNPFIEWLLETELTPAAEHQVRVGVVHDEEAKTRFFQEKAGFFSEWENQSMSPYGTVLLMEGLWIRDRLRNQQFQDWLWEATVTKSPNLSVSLSYQFTTDDELAAREGDDWLSSEMRYSFGEGKHTLYVFYGKERGGLKCTGGVCRQVQAFEGWKIGLDSSF
jgi:hypothetical protein